MNTSDDAAEMSDAEWDAATLDDDSGADVPEAKETLKDGVTGTEPWRVTEDIAGRVGRWSGVRGCSDEDRAVGAMQPHYDQWVAATIAAHADRTPLAKGYGGHRWWKNKTSSAGKRSCKGGWSYLNVYVDFA